MTKGCKMYNVDVLFHPPLHTSGYYIRDDWYKGEFMGLRKKIMSLINEKYKWLLQFIQLIFDWLFILFFCFVLFCYQGQKGEPGDIVDVSMNPLQVVAQRMLTIKGTKWPRWHSSRKVTNDQICVSILLLMHIRRIFQYLWVCTQSSLPLHCRVWCPKSSFSPSNWQQFYVVNFICTTLNYRRKGEY